MTWSFDPSRHFWRSTDGRIYSSARRALVADDDPAFVDFVAEDGFVTSWPRDEAGDETQAALDEVLAFYGLVTDLKAYAAQKRWEREAGGVTVGGVPVATDDRSKVMILGARVRAAADPLYVEQWKGADGLFHPLDAPTLITISDAVAAHVSACFAKEADILGLIDAGAVTQAAEIDAAFAALASVPS